MYTKKHRIAGNEEDTLKAGFDFHPFPSKWFQKKSGEQIT